MKHRLDSWPRLAIGVVAFLIAVALQIGGYEDRTIALAVWGIAIAIGATAFLTWKPIRANIPLSVSLGRHRPDSQQAAPVEEPALCVIHRGIRFEAYPDDEVTTGPICPEHMTPLRMEGQFGSEPVSYETFVQDYPGRRLICPEGGELRFFETDGVGGMRVETAMDEALARLRGMDRRQRASN